MQSPTVRLKQKGMRFGAAKKGLVGSTNTKFSHCSLSLIPSCIYLNIRTQVQHPQKSSIYCPSFKSKTKTELLFPKKMNHFSRGESKGVMKLCVCVCVCVFMCVCQLPSHVLLFETPWTVALQAPLSMEFSQQEYQNGLPFPSPGDLLDSRIKPRSPALQADSLPSELSRK